jgi:C4-dicarboxylate-specific signal transduction histidine kinase
MAQPFRPETLVRTAIQIIVGALAIAIVNLICFRLQLSLAPPLCLDLIVIVLLSLRGSFFSAATVSLVAVGSLDYYFTQPLFSLQVLAPVDGVVILLFLITAAVITTLVSRVRSHTERLTAANTRLEEQILAVKQAQDQVHLARINRVILMGELTASIAHEVNQPLTGIVANAGTGLRYLAGDTPDIDEARKYLGLIARDGKRAGDVVARIRALVKRAPSQPESVDLNETILDVITLTSGELRANSVTLLTRLEDGLPPVIADRVQLQQVILNLIVNATEAMADVRDRPRVLTVSSGDSDSNTVLVAVRDSGPGFDPENIDSLFNSFYTTKPDGMGMGLSISRSIVEAHGGRLSASPIQPRGAAFRFTLPNEKTVHDA